MFHVADLLSVDIGLYSDLRERNVKMIKKIYENDSMALDSFNELTRKTFGFDFIKWHAAGHFGDMYVPHVIMDRDKVVSNVSVNQMQFDVGGVIKNYIQIGTVMTDQKYRGQGLNRKIMESVLQEYEGKTDGIYLFGNDSVLNYYPKFGFVPCKEYEYYFSCETKSDLHPYSLEKVDMSDGVQAGKVYTVLEEYFAAPYSSNENDAMYMSENLGLYHFWLDSAYKNDIYYLPECDSFVVGALKEGKLYLYQIISKYKVELERVARAFGDGFSEVVMGYTPVYKNGLCIREHKEEDCTLFIMGEDLKSVHDKQMMFPILSHA